MTTSQNRLQAIKDFLSGRKAPEIYFPPEQLPQSGKSSFSFVRLSLELTAVFCLLLPAPWLHASTFEQQVVDTAKQYLEKKAQKTLSNLQATRFKTTITPPSSSLRLPVCAVTPRITDISRGPMGDQRLKLQCPEGRQWSLFLRGDIAIYRPVLVANQPLDSGIPVPPSAVSHQLKNLAELDRGYLTHTDELKHQTTRKRIRTGTPIRPDMLTPSTLVERGEFITIVSRIDGVEVSVNGEAMQDGSLHEQIRVRNRSSSRIIHGIVTGRGQVMVN